MPARRLDAGVRRAPRFVVLLRGILLLCGSGMLVGCPSDDSRHPEQAPQRIELVGTVAGGAPAAFAEVLSRPAAGPNIAVGTDAGGRYAMIVEPQAAPFLLQARTVGQLFGGSSWFAVATQPGTVNVTPLTTLVVAELQGDNPNVFFDSLGPSGAGDFSAVSQANIDAAHLKVVKRLQRQLGIAVPANITSFSALAFTALPGDPMDDLLSELKRRLDATGTDFEQLVSDVAEESLRCKAEKLRIEIAGEPEELCPANKENAVDPNDASITIARFINAMNDALVVRTRGTSVLAIEFEREGNVLFACADSACNAVTLGELDGEGNRAVAFAGTALAGATGNALLTGTLVSGNGIPPRNCTGSKIIYEYADGRSEVDCLARRVTTPRFARMSFGFFGKNDASRLLDVRADGQSVVWVGIGPSFGGIDYRCKNSDCAGVSVSPADAQGRRTVSLASALLARANGDGTVNTDDTVRVTANLVSAPPPVPPTAACAVPIRLTLTSSDGVVLPLCDIDPDGGLSVNDADGDGINEQVGLNADATLSGDQVSALFDVVVNEPASVEFLRTFFDAYPVEYRCLAATCAGMTMTRNSEGRYIFEFEGTMLREIDPDGGAGDRTLALHGFIISGLPF